MNKGKGNEQSWGYSIQKRRHIQVEGSAKASDGMGFIFDNAEFDGAPDVVKKN